MRQRLNNQSQVDNLIDKSEKTPLHIRPDGTACGYPGSLSFQPYLTVGDAQTQLVNIRDWTHALQWAASACQFLKGECLNARALLNTDFP